jgi:hypothetical protein
MEHLGDAIDLPTLPEEVFDHLADFAGVEDPAKARAPGPAPARDLEKAA